jgi:hypothetical protein
MDRLLDHRLLSVEREELFRTAFAAERPKARAASSGEDDGIEILLKFFHSIVIFFVPFVTFVVLKV